MPKTVDTGRRCKVELRACKNPPQPHSYMWFSGVVEDCCMLSTLPCSVFLYLQFLAQWHHYTLLHFYTCIWLPKDWSLMTHNRILDYSMIIIIVIHLDY